MDGHLSSVISTPKNLSVTEQMEMVRDCGSGVVTLDINKYTEHVSMNYLVEKEQRMINSTMSILGVIKMNYKFCPCGNQHPIPLHDGEWYCNRCQSWLREHEKGHLYISRMRDE